MNEKELKYSKSHEWISPDKDRAKMGISRYAAEELGDIVFVETKEEGESVNAGDVIGTVESVKAVSDIYAPISGTIMGSNEDVINNPEIVNEDPFEKGWIAEINPKDPQEFERLLSYEDYENFLKSEKE